MNLSSFCDRFNPFFADLFKERARRALCVTDDQFISEILAHAGVLAGSGKRLRPYMAYMGYCATGGQLDMRILHIAAGIELFHTFALVHDDIIDADETRRGIQTLHEFAATRFPARRHAEGMAILVGDIIFQWSSELLSAGELKPYLPAMIDEVSIGQMLDLELAAKPNDFSRRRLDEMIYLKTASYSFIRPLQIGAAAHGISPDLERFFEVFGKAIGFAFQLQDDLFDKADDIARDRPSYFTRGFEAEAQGSMDSEFRAAAALAKSAPVPDSVRTLLCDFVELVRSRTQ